MVHGFLCSFSLEMEMEGSRLTIFVFVSPSISTHTLQISAEEELADFEMDSAGSWGQFETNKRLFNIESTHEESLYTTKMDYEKTDTALAARTEKHLGGSSPIRQTGERRG